MQLDRLAHTDFSEHLESVFTIHGDDSLQVAARLLSVSTMGAEPAGSDQRWAFSLVFHTEEKDTHLVQQIYTLTHPVMGSLDLFLVPLGPDETGMRYEAVFT